MKNRSLLAITAFVVTMLAGGVAFAQGADPDVGGTMRTLLDMIMQGKYLPAVGAVLVLVVAGLRFGGGKLFPWLTTKAGGYVLGFGTSALLYLGTAWESGTSMSLGLFTAALAAGWTAAGGWEHLTDLITWLRNPTAKLPVAVSPTGSQQGSPGAAVGAALVLLGVAGCLALGAGLMQACEPAKHAGVVVIDCTLADAQQTAALLDELKPILAGNPINWSAVEEKAINAGETIGGCVLATLVQDALGGTKATQANTSWAARGALEDFRSKHANGAIFHTKKGDL